METFFARKPCLTWETSEPRVGRFRAKITIEDEPPAVGLLEIGGAKIQGSLVNQGPSNGVWAATFFAGFAGWQLPIPERVFTNVRYSDVVKSIAASVGETVVVDPSADRVVTSYTVPAGPALAVFEDLPWFVDDAGITQVGSARASRSLTVEECTLSDADEAAGHCRGSVTVLPRPRDTVSIDGAIFRLGDVTTSTGGAFSATTGDTASLGTALRAATAPSKLSGVSAYTVAGDLLRPVSGADLRASAVPVWVGPGVSVDFAPSAAVAVAYLGGDRGRPTVIAADLTPPLAYRVRVAPGGIVSLGTSGAIPLARGPQTVAAFSALKAALTTASASLAGPSAPVTNLQLIAVLNALSAAVDGTLIPSSTIFGD